MPLDRFADPRALVGAPTRDALALAGLPAQDPFARARAAHVQAVERCLRRHRGPAAASHESAGIVLGLPTYRIPRQVQLTRPEGSRRNGRLSHVSVAPLEAADVVQRGGIWTTRMARTVVDVGRQRPYLEALVTADGALRAGCRPDDLEAELSRQARWPGIRAARRVVRSADGRAESAAESVTRGRFVLLDLPMPDLQVWIPTPTGDCRVDLWWEQFGLIGEVDGRAKYDGTLVVPGGRDVLWLEKLRQEALEERHGVIRWTWREALAPDAEFRARFLAAVERAQRLQRMLAG